MQVWNVLRAARWKCRTQKIIWAKSQLRHISTIGKNLLSSNISSTCSHNTIVAQITFKNLGEQQLKEHWQILSMVTSLQGVEFSIFPTDFWMGLTTVQRYYAACDSCMEYEESACLKRAQSTRKPVWKHSVIMMCSQHFISEYSNLIVFVLGVPCIFNQSIIQSKWQILRGACYQ